MVGDMSFGAQGEPSLDYLPCRYGNSKLLFRGPKRDLDTPYVAFLGGSETYGKFVETPFVKQLDAKLPVQCVNFGCLNAGVDVFFNDPFVPDAASRACVTVIQVPPAQNMSNRLYTVHPRRNDRFVSATKMMTAIFPDVDFAGFHFNKHLLRHLREISPERYRLVEEELSQAWVARMTALLSRISGRTVLMWVSGRSPEDGNEFDIEPMHVTRAMLDQVQEHVTMYVEICLPHDAQTDTCAGMVFSDLEAPAAKEMIGLDAHAEIANRLEPVLQKML